MSKKENVLEQIDVNNNIGCLEVELKFASKERVPEILKLIDEKRAGLDKNEIVRTQAQIDIMCRMDLIPFSKITRDLRGKEVVCIKQLLNDSQLEKDFASVLEVGEKYTITGIHLEKETIAIAGFSAYWDTKHFALVDKYEKAKSLGNTDINGARKNVEDLVVFGNGDMFKLLCKASSQAEGWMKSTKAMEIEHVGCIVQMTTQQGGNVAEAAVFVPGVKIKETIISPEDIRRELVSLTH